ncbi:sensor histidine kinase [Microbacterium terrisoli]|uniref:sensor histidine kinase n=1 Tax=Microbacterium terrisoli TaxID=3242192 RepID=UPI00280518DA|nr:histidine kinase [Microbacterium protaetiae]
MFRRLTTAQIVIDVTVAVLFALVSLPREMWTTFGGLPSEAISVLVCAIFGAAVAVRRLSPPLALGIAWAGAIVQMSFGRGPAIVDFAVFAVLYTAAAYGSRLVFWFGFSSAIAGAAVATAYLFLVLGAIPLSMSTLTTAVAVLIAATFALLLAWTAGALVRTSRRARTTRVAQQRAEAETAAEAERARIARDMHDVVAHSLAVVIAQADGARYATADRTRLDALETISVTARAALADVRVLLAQLRHRQEDGPQPTIADLDLMFAQMRAAGLELRIDIDPTPKTDPPAATQLAVYRILQEALTNALRHGAGAVEVGLAWHADRVDLSVRNALRPGRATAASPPIGERTARGHGLIGMRERALLVGGELDAAAHGDGFIVQAALPIGGAL